MRKRIALVVPIVFAVLAAASSSAGAAVQNFELASLSGELHNALHTGAFIQIDAPVSSLITEPGKPTQGTIGCEEASTSTFSGLKGTLELNNEKTDKAELILGGGKFAKKLACTNNTALGASVSIAMEPNGAQLNLSASKKKAEIKERSAGQPFYMSLAYSGGGACKYAIKKLKGTLTLGASGEIKESFQKQKFALRKDVSSSLGCPKNAAFSALFTSMIQQLESGESVFVFGFLT
jgi:hypothetical protein